MGLLSACGGLSESRQIPQLTQENVNSFIVEQKKIIRENEDDAEAHFGLSRGYLLKKEFESAEQHARIATRIDPLSPASYEQLGTALYALQRYSDALTELGTATDLDPERVSAYLLLARVYEQIGDTSRAIAVLEEILQRDRYYVEALFFLARLQLRQHEYDSAIRVLDELIRLQPSNREALLLRIQAYSTQGSFYYARTLIEEMIREHPDYQPLQLELLRILFSQGQWDEARTLIKNLESYDKRHGWRGPVNENVSLEEFKNIVLNKKNNYRNKKLALVTEVSNDKINIYTEENIKSTITKQNYQWARRYISSDYKGPKIKNANQIVKANDLIFVSKNKKTGEYILDQIPIVNGGVVVMNPWNGRVYALVGGYNFDLNQFNRVTQAKRQPGSAFKPFVYATALENGFKPNDLILDAPFVLDQNKGEFKWKPSNYGKKFYGLNTFRSGIEKSKNLTTVRIAQKVGLDKINTISKKLNIYNEPIQILSYSLGSGETNLINLASAYASFVNGGKKISPTLIDHIQDQNGKTIFKNKKIECYGCNKDYLKGKPPTIKYNFERVFSDSTAFQMVNILKGVVDRGTAKKIKNLNIELGGKTGTTNDNFDAWFIGFTPNVLIGVYVGFDEPATLGKKETGSKAALPIFRDIVKQLNLNTDRPFFKVPPSIKLEKIDVNSGKIVKSKSKNTIVEGFKINSMTKKTNSINPVNNGIY